MTESTEAGVVAELARAANKAVTTVKLADGREMLVTPAGFQTTDTSDMHGLKVARPIYVKQNAVLQRVDSLVDYVKRFKEEESVIFADIANNKMVAILDYHGASDAAVGKPLADHLGHKAVMQLEFSQEWQRWKAIDGKMMGQLIFARFIEENAPDIAAPSGGELLDVVKDLHANRKVNFIKAVRTASNNENFEFSNETNLGTIKGGIEVPTQFLLKIPVYFGEPADELRAYLRWELGEDGGGLSLGVALTRAEYVRQARFQLLGTMIQEKTGCPLVYGRAD